MIFLSSLAFIVSLTACHHQSKKNKQQKIIVAQERAAVKKLYFSGILSPISTLPVVSPVGGNIVAVSFVYGQRIVAGEKIIVLNSPSLAESYRKAVDDFLHKKQSYLTGKTTFIGTQALHKAGVISENDYVSGKTQYDNAVLNYYESKYALEKVLKKAHMDSAEVESLSLSDTDKVNAILERHFHNIAITAPGSGVALFPPKKSGNDEDSHTSGKLRVGDSVKEGDLLLSIGDLSGLSATFDVSEVDVNSIHQNMTVVVTGTAFPNAVLHGVITSVSAQANQSDSNEGNGLSMFAVKINITQIDPKIMAKIRVGMTAKFEIDIHSPPHILLPVNAVSQRNGHNVVTIIDATGQEKTVPVLVGETSPNHIVIISGIKAGDKVVVPSS